MPDEIRSIRTFRAALNGVAAAKTHYAVEPHGLRPTDFKGWLVANSSIPEIDRLVALSRKLTGGDGKVQGARFDPSGFAPLSRTCRSAVIPRRRTC